MISYYKGTLLRLFQDIQVIRNHPQENRERCLNVQERLIVKIVYVERQIRKIRLRIGARKQSLANRLPKAEAREVKQEIEYLRYAINEYQRLLRILRTVGDALAFIYITLVSANLKR